MLVTCRITLVSFVLAFVIGLVTALLRLSRSMVGAALARVYLEVVRNTPLLVQIFFVYFVLGPILGISRGSFPSRENSGMLPTAWVSASQVPIVKSYCPRPSGGSCHH
ncbi:MAG: hypothetical protein B1H13_11670 [Desulfobacteraceae bacterium 4484_190.3]|nr:MAG: hypothetical protein B1H13_11670 [Desulfobacteraceae bacterium 4484_190.3]